MTAKHDSDVRARLRAARRQARLSVAEMQAHHLERINARLKHNALKEQGEQWDWIGAFQDAADASFNSPDQFATFISLAWHRRYGQNWPFWRTWQEHARLRGQARLLWTLSPLAYGALNCLKNYVIGNTGATYRIVARQNLDVPTKLIDKLHEITDRFSERNDWLDLQKELLVRDHRDGEYFLRYFSEDEWSAVRTVEPEQILEPPNFKPEEYSFGVKNLLHPDGTEDLQRIVAFWVTYDGDPSHGEEVEVADLDHVKNGVDRVIKRGLSDFTYTTYDLLKTASRMLDNMAEAGAIQASIAIIREHEAAGPAAIGGMVDGLATYTETDPITSNLTSVERYESGRREDIPRGMKYVTPPFATNAQGFVQVVQAVMRAVAVRWNAPEWVVSGDASNNNYASSLTAESPFVRYCGDQQGKYKKHFRRPIYKSWESYAEERGGIEAGGHIYSYDEVMSLVELQCEFPTAEVRNKLEEAQANSIRLQGKWKSPQTIQQEEGLDSEQEFANIEQFDDRFQAQGEPLPLPGEGSPLVAPPTLKPPPLPKPPKLPTP